MKYITSLHLAAWAPQRVCQEELPRLIRRLIQASPVEIRKMLFPAGNNVIIPGYDGTLEVSGKYLHIPDEKSVWEIGSGNNPNEKANGDLLKRTGNTSTSEQAKLTFVFVTPYVWRDKDEWIKNKTAETSWKEIRVIDGLELEEWIETVPAVGNWLAKMLGLPQGHALPLDQHWEEWSNNGVHSIPQSLLLNGREKEIAALTKFLAGSASVLAIKASSADEAQSFVAASIGQMAAEEGERYFARAILVDNEATLRDLSTSKTPMIILTGPCTAGLLQAAARNGHHVLVLAGMDLTNSGSVTLELQRIHRHGFEKALDEMGFEFEERERAIKNSGLNLTVLRRQLEFDRFKQPTWASDGHQFAIIPALLVGKWDEQNEADKELISELAGEAYEIYIKKLTRWKIGQDPPVTQVRSIWRITSPLDAWNLLAPFVTVPDVQKFKTAFLHASGELNPALELDLDQRYMANLLGKVPRYSNALKEGMAESLILMAVYGESFKLSLSFSSQAFADSIIRDLLHNADGPKWCSLSDRLPLLAEASPEAFLKAVETSLLEEDSAVMEMFQEGRDPFYTTGSYHTGLLWALEGLAYSQEYLWRVTAILGILSRLDPGGRLSNRPINTLRQMNVSWYRQVNAEFSARKVVLEKLMQKEPDVAWQVLLSMLPEFHGGHTSNIHCCHWRFVTQLERTVSHQEVWDLHSFALDGLLLLAKGNTKRAGVLVSVYPDLSMKDRAKLLQFLTESRDELVGEENSVWDALRKLLGKHRAHPDTAWALPKEELQKLEVVFNLYATMNDSRSVLYMFREHWPEFAAGPRKWNVDEYGKFIKVQRAEALRSIYQQGGLSEILKMAPLIDDLRYLGESLVDVTINEEEETLLIKGIAHELLSKQFMLSNHYLFARSIKEKDDFADCAWSILLSGNPTSETKAAFFLSLVPTRKIWTMVESQDPDVGEAYWKKVNVWLNHHTPDERLYAISKLQQVHRHIMLIQQVSYFVGELATNLLVKILVNAATIKSQDTDQFEEYPVCILFTELQKRTDVSEDELFNLEWLYLYILTGHYSQCKPSTLYKRLSSDPHYFVELISILYRPDKSEADEQVELLNEEEQQERYRQAGMVRQLLESWRIIPGTGADGSIDGDILKTWVNSVRNIGSESKRVKAVDIEIGKLLACGPHNADIWPSEAVAGLIDSMDSETVISNFETEIFNSRGVTVKGAYEGGDQERSLSGYFERMSNLHMLKFPVTATALRRMANNYKQDGMVEDERAHLDELR